MTSSDGGRTLGLLMAELGLTVYLCAVRVYTRRRAVRRGVADRVGLGLGRGEPAGCQVGEQGEQEAQDEQRQEEEEDQEVQGRGRQRRQ